MTLTSPPEVAADEPGRRSPPPAPVKAPAPTRVGRALVAFLTSKRTALAVMLSMAGLALAGTLIDQAPDTVRHDPADYGAWLDTVRPHYGVLTDRMYALGLFHVFASVWFRLAAALMVVSILVNTAQRLPGLVRRTAGPAAAVDDRTIEQAPLRETVETPLAPPAAAIAIAAALGRGRYRVLELGDPGRPVLYADRFRFQPLATIISHAAVVLVIVGIVLTAGSGFRDEEFAVTVGESRPVGHDTGLFVHANAFTDSYDPTGRPTDYASELVLIDGDRIAASRTVRVNHPLRAEGIAIYQSFFGNAAVLMVQSPGAAGAVRRSVPLQWSNAGETRMIGRWTDPDDGTVVVVQGPASGRQDDSLPPGDIRVDLVRADQTVISGDVLSPGDSLASDGWRITFERERPFTGLIVAHDPGARWVWAGSLLMVAGLIVSLMLRHRRLWVRIRPTDQGSVITLACPDRRDRPVSSWFDRSVERVRTAVRVATTPPGGHHA